MSSQNKPKPTETPAEVTIQNVVNPKLFPEPNSIRNPELYKYVSIDSHRIQQSFNNYKRSGIYILGILGGCALASVIVDKLVQHHIFGMNGNGGNFLKMYTRNSNDDYYYNREFQRMRYLTEEPVGDDPTTFTRPEQLSDLGFLHVTSGNNFNVQKKAPHYKYF